MLDTTLQKYKTSVEWQNLMPHKPYSQTTPPQPAAAQTVSSHSLLVQVAEDVPCH